MSFVLIVGSGRVGSTVARNLLAAGHEVSVLDGDPLSHERLDAGQDSTWEGAGGRFTIGQAIERDALVDNTNLTIAQIAQKMFNVPRVLVRVMDPARAEWYSSQGMETICPTSYAVGMFEKALEMPEAGS